MSISIEEAKKYAKEPAVICCRLEKGDIIEAESLEDPTLFPDMIDMGLIEIPENVLTIEEVMGVQLASTQDALIPLTKDMVENINIIEEEETSVKTTKKESVKGNPDFITLRIGSGEDIELSIPLSISGAKESIIPPPIEEVSKDIVTLRKLKKKYYSIEKISRGEKTSVFNKELTIRKDIEKEMIDEVEFVKAVTIDIINKNEYNQKTDTIMDVQPIAVKEEGKLGTGVTKVIDGAILVLTGTDEKGVQIGEFGTSEGFLDKQIKWGRPGAPDTGEIIIRVNIKIKAGMGMERPGPLAAHKAADILTEEIRQSLKETEDIFSFEEIFEHKKADGRKKVLIVKEIMGQGAMHDNLILPEEPVGIFGGKANIDLGNLPVVLSPLEVLDGGIHALTCIGPASKETSRHYFREPLIIEALEDEEINLAGVMLVGSPQINAEKFYVSERLGMAIEAIEPDGVILTTEGFGNNHIDFAAHHEEIGKRGINLVGMTFAAVQGALIVGNEYMGNMIDLNKSEEGIENEILSDNTLCKEDAQRALAMLKSVMAGELVESPERNWSSRVKEENISKIERAKSIKIERADNEI